MHHPTGIPGPLGKLCSLAPRPCRAARGSRSQEVHSCIRDILASANSVKHQNGSYWSWQESVDVSAAGKNLPPQVVIGDSRFYQDREWEVYMRHMITLLAGVPTSDKEEKSQMYHEKVPEAEDSDDEESAEDHDTQKCDDEGQDKGKAQ
ncbi:hypothetical protein PAAG_11540 [Paracoccidioides lutzii Pb01]|uniref:Uncharacterized protein n=1 Tax=Paracoccidioides lutzii (strain ATCC MYA-826 / Pb01) TaxID=502779 RepID=A0A0A2VLI1_PARBA|nr:hypothetical protein PAAG_11540 [Paracoccidioides lutzii Pb01]KGQ01694.1 hypothetical protein PAAG_11540 [Paracoccidioides lutzii Pb01]